jgi:Ca2+-binding EF-hand superfamily protein
MGGHQRPLRIAFLCLACALGALWAPGTAWAQRTPATTEREVEVRDLVFLGPQGIVLMRLNIDAGSRSVTTIRRDYTAVVFRTLDANADGLLAADEAARIPAAGQLSASAEQLGDGWQALDVAPQDGALSVDELFPFVDERLGPRFKIELKTRLQQSVRLKPLDLNGDELVSRDEVEQGLVTLHGFDFDDDEALSVAELQPFPTAIRQALLQQQASEPAQLPLMSIDSPAEYEAACDRILTFYGSSRVAVGQPLAIAIEQVGGLLRETVEAADQNRDNVLDREELRELLSQAEPALALDVLVRRNAVRVDQKVPAGGLVEFLPRTREAPNRQQAMLAGMSVSLGASNNREGFMSDAEVIVNQVLIQFIQADADKNRYLNESEFATVRATFAQVRVPDVEFAGVDADGDGMLTRDELKAYVETNAGLSEATLVLSVSDDAKTLFDILDGNLDNRLTPREFQEGYTRMRRYDQDKDGQLGIGELRSHYGFIVSPARPEFLLLIASDQMMQANPGMARVTPMTSGPTWFRKMDRNQDGDLTWREFLGTREAFDGLDSDGNALIDLNEAVAIE